LTRHQAYGGIRAYGASDRRAIGLSLHQGYV
jgi:hypothetical protein